MGALSWRAWSRGRRWRAAACACAAALLVAAAAGALRRGGVRAELETRREYPRSAPSDVAHRLADFSTLPHALNATPGSWRVEEQRGDFSSWRYRVTWSCGARCTGAAAVAAHAQLPPGRREPSHARAPRHRVALHVRTCTEPALRLLAWWGAECDEMEISADVVEDGAGGAVLRERARASCCKAAGGGGDACADALRRHRTQHHDRIAQP